MSVLLSKSNEVPRESTKLRKIPSGLSEEPIVTVPDARTSSPGRFAEVSFYKRLMNLCNRGDKKLDINEELMTMFLKRVESGMADQMTTREIDLYLAKQATGMSKYHTDFSLLAGRIMASSLHNECKESFKDAYLEFKKHPACNLDKEFVNLVETYGSFLDKLIKRENDYNYDYFAISTLQTTYLLHEPGNFKKFYETPQYMLMRVSLWLFRDDIEGVKECYERLSARQFTFATPGLSNAGTDCGQMSSCFLVPVGEDSMTGIVKSIDQCLNISQKGGGIGLKMDVRGAGTLIKGHNGTSNGISDLLPVYDKGSRYADQGGNKRKGAWAVYLEAWHTDLVKFLSMKRLNGHADERARNLFYGLWIPDLFMQRVLEKGKWTLFSGAFRETEHVLWNYHGEEFEKYYLEYERNYEKHGGKQYDAQELFFAIIEAQKETGTPYMLFKDRCNATSNHNHMVDENGFRVIKQSNLCTEVIQWTSSEEVAVCNLASVSLPYFMKKEGYDHQGLYDCIGFMVRAVNQVIKYTKYPIPETLKSNMKHRPIGLGTQGLANVFDFYEFPWESQEARDLNREIFETIYFAALTESHRLGKEEGVYESFEGSLYSKGILQFDMWEDREISFPGMNIVGRKPVKLSGRWDWVGLREKIKEGLRNSLLIAPMPTASTSQLLGNVECFEPWTSNIFSRRVIGGTFPLIKSKLQEDLRKEGLWSIDMYNKIVANKGSVQDIPEIPERLKELHKTAYEIKNGYILKMAADRGAFIDQNQSLNIFYKDPTFAEVSQTMLYGWLLGLKGFYYLRRPPAISAGQFSLGSEIDQGNRQVIQAYQEPCESCTA